MNTILIYILLVFLNSGWAGDSGEMTIEISGIKPLKGNLLIALYDDSNTFMIPDSAYKKAKITVLNKTESVMLKDVVKGEYAIVILHDTNKNQELDFHSNGIPKEGFGFSNEARGRQGPPLFEDAKFTFDGNGTVKIRMINSIFNKGKVKDN